MNDLKILKIFLFASFPFLLFIVLFVSLLAGESANETIVVTTEFHLPFTQETRFSVTSSYGYRIDPIEKKQKFHSGIDLGTSCGTNILASNQGIVYEVGYNEEELGNYVYLKHNSFDLGIIYSVYGHMLDDSITVVKDELVNVGQVIGQVGTTGRSTGCHLHFMLMKEKISFLPKDLIDPSYIISQIKRKGEIIN